MLLEWNTKETIAANRDSLEIVQKITGLDIQTIQNIQTGLYKNSTKTE